MHQSFHPPSLPSLVGNDPAARRFEERHPRPRTLQFSFSAAGAQRTRMADKLHVAEVIAEAVRSSARDLESFAANNIVGAIEFLRALE